MTGKCVAFIQARVSSTRLPGKVLQPLDGLPMVVYMARRVQRARLVDEVVVVTSTDASDDALAMVLHEHGIACFRGPLDDVLLRFRLAASTFGADDVVRLTGDCPLIDPVVVDAVVRLRRESHADYASNCDPPTFPDGLDVECFTRSALDRASREARMESQREHVTPWMREPTSGLVRSNLRALADFSALRLTVDHADDLEVVRALVQALPGGRRFDLWDVLRLLAANGALRHGNPHPRNEGWARSVRSDKEIPT